MCVCEGWRGGEPAVCVQVCMSVYVYTTTPSPEHCLTRKCYLENETR